MLGLLDDPEQRQVQNAAPTLLNEPRSAYPETGLRLTRDRGRLPFGDSRLRHREDRR
jgi:hypothetical protein